MATWHDIPGHPGYQITPTGDVRSLDRLAPSKRHPIGTQFMAGKLLRSFDNGKGYLAISLGGRRALIHTLVLETFVGPRPNGCEGCHKDGNRRNNSSNNLYWGTRSDNMRDAVQHGTCWSPSRYKAGEKHHGAKLTEQQVIHLRELRKQGVSLRELSAIFRIAQSTVSAIATGRLWKLAS